MGTGAQSSEDYYHNETTMQHYIQYQTKANNKLHTLMPGI